MMRAGRICGVLALAGLLAAPAPAPAAETLKITVVSGLKGKHEALRVFHHQFRKVFETKLQAAGGGYRIEWQLAYGGVLARPGGVLEAVEDSLAEIGIVEIAREPERLPLHDVTYQAPFASTRCDIVASAFHGLHQDISAMTEPWTKGNQRYLATIATDSYGVMSHPKITKPGDLRGLAMAAPVRTVAWFEPLEATVARLPEIHYSDVLEDGQISAVAISATDAVRLELYEVAQKYLSAGLGAQASFVLSANAGWYEGLPEPVRIALDETAAAFISHGSKAYCRAGAEALETLSANGVLVARLFRTRRLLWAEALPPVGTQWARDREEAGLPGQAVLKGYLDRLRAAGITMIRNWDG